jgi:hypothetical protein
MGLLKVGKTLTYEESKSVIEYVKDHGITQLINVFDSNEKKTFDKFLWGDEVI